MPDSSLTGRRYNYLKRYYSEEDSLLADGFCPYHPVFAGRYPLEESHHIPDFHSSQQTPGLHINRLPANKLSAKFF